MSTATVESFVRRLFSDAAFRREAAFSSSDLLARFDFTKAERASLAKLCERLAKEGGELPSLPTMEEARYWA